MGSVTGTYQAQVLWKAQAQGYQWRQAWKVPVMKTIPWEQAKTIPVLGLGRPPLPICNLKLRPNHSLPLPVSQVLMAT